ncbi:MAG TPA: FtsX-like permease family protein, partial [Steroidobacteraceae bacterium]|nr:FtsX-like permease family protein [Steroidobacteraceae bacterium]
MSLLQAATLRHLARHRAQLALALLGLTLGVGTIVAVDLATASAHTAFELSLKAVNGPATHQITGGPQGIEESVYVGLKTAPPDSGGEPPRFAPVVEGYAGVGGRLLRLVGVDPFAALEARPGGDPGAGPASPGSVREWLTVPGGVVLGAETARELRLAPGSHLELTVGGRSYPAQLLAVVPGDTPGFDALVLTDIAQAQEWLQAPGRLSRIDALLPPGEAGAALARALQARLPAPLAVRSTRASSEEAFAMTQAFTTNLRAMSLLALLVGTFLIYGAVSFAVLQRRRTLAVLRALGARRGEVLALVLREALLLGLLGALLGVLAGLAIGHLLVGLVARTINDLYFVVAVREVALPAVTVLKALAAGVATALVAALVPALEVATSPPSLALSRAVLEGRARRVARLLVVLAVLFGAAAWLTIGLSTRSLYAGFLALFLVLLAVAALTPAVLEVLARSLARLAGARSAALRLALTDIARSLSRTGVAVAALGMALTAMIGVAVMVASFRGSLAQWLVQTLRADVYVSAPGPTDALARRIEPQVVRALLAVPGVRAASFARRVVVDSPAGELDLNALRLGPQGGAGFRVVQGDPAAAWRGFAQGAVLISEPLAWRLRLAAGGTLSLATPAGMHDFPVAAVYREY